MRNVGWVKWKMDAPLINTHPAHIYLPLSFQREECQEGFVVGK